MDKESAPKKEDHKGLWSIIGASVAGASLCCLSPIILVLFGISGVAFASSLADTLYGDFKWVFRGVGLLLLLLGIAYYYWKKGVCTFDAVKQRRNEILNTILIAVVSAIIGYIVFLYVIVHYIGVWMGLWV
ncbi:hypothetical protein GOV10_01015 [Candidatus Woesearchaeota archaeon]|nr:hypothetical protein [Candidatus Woesearchaeota archaeon]